MANTVIVTKLIDGPRNAYFHVALKSDGASGELIDQVIIDPAIDFSPTLAQKPTITIEKFWYSLLGFDVKFEFDALVDTPVWSLPRASDSTEVCFQEFGGLKDRSPTGDANSTGRLLISTQGFVSATNTGTFVIKVRKN